MKLAVVSDIHGNLPALQAVLQEIEREGVDRIVNLGDILSGPLLPAETADFLMARGDWITITGNHERQLLRVRARPREQIRDDTSDGYAALQVSDAHCDWLRSLPATHRMDDVLLVHGTPSTDMVYLLETVIPGFAEAGHPGIRAASTSEIEERLGDPQATLVLCGHSHIPRAMQCGGALVVNPGSVGVQGYWDEHPHYHVVETAAPHARYAIVERTPQGWSAQLRAVAYDCEPLARLAAARGRDDWAYALATGRIPARYWKI